MTSQWVERGEMLAKHKSDNCRKPNGKFVTPAIRGIHNLRDMQKQIKTTNVAPLYAFKGDPFVRAKTPQLDKGSIVTSSPLQGELQKLNDLKQTGLKQVTTIFAGPLDDRHNIYEEDDRNAKFSDLDLLKLEIADWIIDKISTPQIVIGSEEEAYFIYHKMHQWPDTMRSFIQTLIGDLLDTNPFVWEMFTYFGKLKKGSLSTYESQINKFRKAWNHHELSPIFFPNLAKMIMYFRKHSGAQIHGDTISEAMYRELHKKAAKPPTVKGLTNSLKHIYKVQHWHFPQHLSEIEKALKKFFPHLPNPSLGMGLEQFTKYLKITLVIFTNKYCIIVAQVMRHTYNWLRLIASRPEEGYILIDNIHIRVYSFETTDENNKPIAKRGLHLWLTEAKNIDPSDFQPQFVNLRETTNPLHNVVRVTLELRKFKQKLAEMNNWKHPTQTLLFHPLTGEQWTKKTFEPFWNLTVKEAKKVKLLPEEGKYSSYTLRKCHGSISCDIGIGIEEITAVQRNKTSTTVEAYYTRQYQHKRGIWYCQQLDEKTAKDPKAAKFIGIIPPILNNLEL